MTIIPNTSSINHWDSLRLSALRLTLAWELGSVTLRHIRKEFPDLPVFLKERKQWDDAHLSAAQKRGLEKALLKDPQPLLQLMEEQKIRFLLPEDADFPSALQKMADAPFAIFLRGATLTQGMHVGIVGTRQMTEYGKHAAAFIAGELARYNTTVVSGFALGIDMAAQTACVDAGGRTIGVLPGGIENASIVPRTHARFAEQLLSEDTGTLLSEYPPGTPILPFHFLIRNRLIAALSDAVVVAEADHESGALVTARLALEIGREVLAVPGSIFSATSRGTNKLIADGARICCTAEDIFSALGFQDAERAKQIVQARQEIPVSPQEERVLKVLRDAKTVDELSRILQEPIATITATISLLELKGRILSVGPRTYIRNK